MEKDKIKVYLDVSLQVSQLVKTGISQRNEGCSMGLVSLDKETKYSTFLYREELDRIIKYYQNKDIPLKTIYVKIHCFMIYLCLEPVLEKIEEISLCKDFNPTILTRELYLLFPRLRGYNINWNGGKGKKSPADKYANKIRKYPEFASQILTLERIKDMETPHKE